MLTRRVLSVLGEGANNQLTAIRGRRMKKFLQLSFGRIVGGLGKSFEVTGRWVFQCLGLTGGTKKTR